MKLRILSFLLFTTISSTTYAEQGFSVDGLFGVGLTSGGDTLGTVIYSDGDTANIDAGGLFHIYGGFLLNNPQNNFQMKFALGWHFDGVTAANGTASFDRYPLDIMPYYKTDNVRVGLGLSYHLNPELDASDFAGGSVASFDNAAGVAFELGFNFGSRHHWLDLRYLSIDYDISNAANIPAVDGSHIGIYYSYNS